MKSTKKRLASLVILSLVLAANLAQAGCEESSLGLQSFTICKVWPAYDGQTIVATSTFKPDSVDANNDGGNVDLELSVIHSTGSKPLATYRKTDAYYSDAVAYDGLVIDTARYKLTPDDRAFGIRSSFGHHSSVSPYNKTELALYIKEGETLRPVLEALVISTSRGEWDGNCAGQGEETLRTVDIGKTMHNGFADLVITSTVTMTENFVVGDECQGTSKKMKPTRVTLSYDGKHYVVPEALRG